MMTRITRSKFNAFPYHLVFPSPWPIISAMSALGLALVFVLTAHGYIGSIVYLWISVINMILAMVLWFIDMITEGTYLGYHTRNVQKGLMHGFLLFVGTEVLFFIGIFWAYLHSALNPAIELGLHWPPLGIDSIGPFELPLLNTVILLSSSITVTLAHHAIIFGNKKYTEIYLLITIILAIIFIYFQYNEYTNSTFTIADSVYGSAFYFGTGFHGLHVMIGALFLMFGFVRIVNYHFTDTHHVGLEASILYWHVIDLIWLVLYIVFYWWGS